MSHPLISRNPDLAKLRDEGYEVLIREEHLLVTGVPYVTPDRTIALGTLVSALSLSEQKTVRPETHVAFFIGSAPCRKDGSRIKAIEHGEENQKLAEGLVVNRSFSNKPPRGYADYHQKMTRYIEIISGPAISLDEKVTPRTFRPVESQNDESVFAYWDTNSSRAHISAVSEKLKGRRPAIVGVGGTGSYILDLVAKTPVAEIHLFDGDWLLQHNAFRSPGAPGLDQLKERPTKVDYLYEIYSKMHRGIRPHFGYLDSGNLAQLDAVDFVFLCVDRGPIKKEIVNYLERRGVSFIDVGMGVNLIDDKLIATLRTTTSTSSKRDHVPRRIPFGEAADNDYATNIQIADLNMLNAAMAVIKWKKLCGFYHDQVRENHSTYTLDCNMLLSEDADA